MANDVTYPIIIVPISADDGGGYMAFAPDLYGCTSDGETEEEAITNVHEAIGEWIDEARRLKRKIPAPGEMAKKANQERKALKELIKQQDAALQESARALSALHSELNSMKEQLNDFQDDYICIGSAVGWKVSPGMLVVASLKKGNKGGDGDLPH